MLNGFNVYAVRTYHHNGQHTRGDRTAIGVFIRSELTTIMDNIHVVTV